MTLQITLQPRWVPIVVFYETSLRPGDLLLNRCSQLPLKRCQGLEAQ